MQGNDEALKAFNKVISWAGQMEVMVGELAEENSILRAAIEIKQKPFFIEPELSDLDREISNIEDMIKVQENNLNLVTGVYMDRGKDILHEKTRLIKKEIAELKNKRNILKKERDDGR